MRYYVKINGVSSLTIPGLAIRELPSISKTLMRNQKETIDGRDGDLITELGYSAYDKTLQIGLFGTYDINQIIAFFNQKGTIVFSDEDDKYYNFTILDQIDYDKLVKFRTASVRIHCQPFKYPLTETPVEVTPELLTGEGSNITLNNTDNWKLGLGLKGDTYQYSTTGKNLASLETSSTKRIGGVDFTINNGIININGTTQSSGSQSYFFNSFRTNSGSAKFWAEITGYTDPVSNNASIILQQSTDNSTWSTLREIIFKSTSTHEYNVTLDSSKYYRIRWFVENNTFTNATIKIQLEYGNSKTDFEPYTGNNPSPSPDYPQDIEVVTGEQNILVRNKNLFSGWVKNQRVYNTNGAVTTENRYLSTNQIRVNENTQYYIKGLTTDYGNKFVSFYDKNNTYLSRTGANNVNAISFTTPSSAYYCRVVVNSQFPTDNDMNSYVENTTIQLELGNQATDYTPHQEQNYEINLGKNVCNPQGYVAVGTANYVAIGIFMTQISSPFTTAQNYRGVGFIAKVQANKTYVISDDVTFAGGYTYLVGIYANENEVNDGSKILQKFEMTGNTFTPSYDGYAVISKLANTSGTTITWSYIQVEVGTTPTTYSPYKTPIELCKIGTYQDYIYKSGADWKIHREIGKVTLTSSMSINLEANLTNVSRFRFNNVINAKETLGICNNNRYLGAYSSDTQHFYILSGLTQIYYFIDNTLANTLNGFKTWLDNNETIVYYPLATPTEETITDTELIEQLETLVDNAVSYEDQTNINAIGELPFDLYAVTLKKGTNEATINNTGNIYAKPTIAIIGMGTVGVYQDNTQILNIDMSTKHYITIDTEKMEAYNTNDPSELLNRKVTGDYSKIKLLPGNNTLKFTFETQMQKATITNWKRWL